MIGRIRLLQKAIKYGGRYTGKNAPASNHRTVKIMTDKATNIVTMTDSATQMTHVADQATETEKELIKEAEKQAKRMKKTYIEESQEFDEQQFMQKEEL